MRFLISNYSTPWNTEPLYINNCLLNIKENSKILNPNNSIYDEFDAFKPDVFITHISHLNKDIIHYILNNGNHILLVINTNYVDSESINKVINDLHLIYGIKIILFGEKNIDSSVVENIAFLPSADVFLPQGEKKYSIQKLIFVEKEEEITELDGTYHYTSCNNDLFNKVDFTLPINVLNTLFPNYKEIIFKGGSYIGTQLSFNAIYSGAKVIFDTKEKIHLDKIDDIFKGGSLLSSVKNRHTCINRVKTLLSQLPIKDKIEIDGLKV